MSCMVISTRSFLALNLLYSFTAATNTSNGEHKDRGGLEGGIHWERDSKYLHDLKVHLFGPADAHYRHYIKPPGRLDVNISLCLNRMTDLNELTQTLTVVTWMHLQWVDHNIHWDPDDAAFGGIDMIQVPTWEIWEPDVTLWNNVADEYHHIIHEPTVFLTHEGHVTWIEPRVYQTVCSLDVYLFPFDSHVCKFTYGSWTYDKSNIIMHLTETSADLTHFIKNTVWEMDEFYAYTSEHRHEGPDGELSDYSTVTFEVDFSRRWMLPFVYVVIPTFLINILSLFGFILPVESNEKIGLQITLFLSLLVYLLLLQQLLPLVEEIPLLVSYILIVLFNVTINILCCVITSGVFFSGTHDNSCRSSIWVRKLLLKKIAPWIGRGRKINLEKDLFGFKSHLVEGLEVNESENEDEDLSQEEDNEPTVETFKSPKMRQRFSIWQSPIEMSTTLDSAAVGPYITKKSTKVRRKDLVHNKDMLLYKILKHCEYFQENTLYQQGCEAVQLEWKLISLVLDRMFFIANLVFSLVLWHYILYQILFF